MRVYIPTLLIESLAMLSHAALSNQFHSLRKLRKVWEKTNLIDFDYFGEM